MKRDQELKRLIHCAKSLGIEVIKRPTRDGCIAEFDYDNFKLYLYLNDNESKLSTIFTIIHELAHAKSYLSANKIHSKKLHDALVYATEHDKNLPKNVYKILLQHETNDLKYWDEIIRDCNIKIPKWRVEFQKEKDILVYELDYLLGEAHNKKVYREYLKILKRKYHAGKRPATS